MIGGYYGDGIVDAQMTFDNRIIATWLTGALTNSGYIDSSIRIYSIPDTGSPDGLKLTLSDLTLDRVISIPSNMSNFRMCQSNLLSDQTLNLFWRKFLALF